MRTYDLVLCESPDGWSLHAPGSSDSAIALGEAPSLSHGDGEPTQADYDAAAATWSAQHDALIDRIRAGLADCITEARKQGWTGADRDYAYTREDLAWVVREIGATPTREEWREAGAGYVLGPVADAD